jgi:hypothetical protein
VYLLKRKKQKFGKNLARCKGWIMRLTLMKAAVNMMSDVNYEILDDA